MIALFFAVALQFHGVIGQSAAPNEMPLGFTGVRSLIELPGERVLFIGDDGGLYEVRDGHPFATGKPARGTFLDFDGRTLRAFGRCSGVWAFVLATLDAKRIVGPSDIRWDLAGVRPETPNHPFADRCKFVTWDPKGDRVEELRALLKSANEKGANLLLNIGPQPDGRLPVQAIDRLERMVK